MIHSPESSTGVPAAKWWGLLLLVSPLLLGLSGCQSLLVTTRPEGHSLPERQELQLAELAYQDILRTSPESENALWNQMLDRVGHRIAIVSGRPDYEWEFTLLSGSQAEAFCLPGGKVAVYEGLLPVCENEAGLAAVLSHEMVHMLKHHGSDTLTRQLALESDDGVFQRIRDLRNPKHVEMMQLAYGVKPQLSSARRFTPQQQAEATTMGLTLMARAGYDPQEAEQFWARLDQTRSSQTPGMLAKLPSREVRAAQFQEALPRATSVYQGAPQRRGLGEQIPVQALAALDKQQNPVAENQKSLRVETPQFPAPAFAQENLRITESSSVAAAPAAAAPTLTDAPPWSVSAVSVAPAPIVQVLPAELPAVVTASLTTLPISAHHAWAPTVEGQLVPPATPLVIRASAESPTNDASGSVIRAHALPFPADLEANSDRGDAPAWFDSGEVAEEQTTQVPKDSSDWKPHQPSP